jgi:hypothetical protein
VGDDAHLFHPVDGRDADSSHFAVDQHLAGTALADAAFQRAVAAIERMAMNGEAGLVKRFRYRVAFATLDFLAVKHKFNYLPLGNVKYRMLFNLVHCGIIFELFYIFFQNAKVRKNSETQIMFLQNVNK